jgi:hypothetical protein
MHKKFQKMYCFGDSWGAGAELNFSAGEKPFAELISIKRSCQLKNFSQPGMPLGIIVREIARQAKKISSNDLVLVVIPPDSRWYTEWKTINYNKKNNFFKDKTHDWFEYHHQLFIFTICEILNKTKAEYLLMHNYGNFPLTQSRYYFSNFYQEKFLDTQSLTALLTGDTDNKSPIDAELTQDAGSFYGPYFEGCETHPNQKGHEKIAELIEQRLQ